VPPKPPRPVHPLLAGQGSNVDGIVGGVDSRGGGWLKRGWDLGGTPQFHLPPAYLSPHARYRAPLIRFAGRILTYRRASRRRAFIGTTPAGVVRYMCGGVQRSIVFSRGIVPTTCGVSFSLDGSKRAHAAFWRGGALHASSP
jgi:hypothetical protein